MISEKINEFIGKILEKTELNELDWKNVDEIFIEDSESVSMPKALSDFQQQLLDKSNNLALRVDDSFFLCKNGNYLFLLHIGHAFEHGNIFKDSWVLWGILNSKPDNFIQIPDYHPANEPDRFKKISDLIVKNKAAEQGQTEKQLLDFFDSFL